MRRILVGIGGAIPTLALVADGCRTATQVTLDIQTNVECSRMRGVDIVVAADTTDAENRAALVVKDAIRFSTAQTADCTEGALRHIGTLVVTPGGDQGAVVVIAGFGTMRAEDCKAGSFTTDCIVARRVFSFVDHQHATLPILLDATCAGIPCSSNSTCVEKHCLPSQVECTSDGCSSPSGPEQDASSPAIDGGSVAPPPPPPPGVPPPVPPPVIVDSGADADGEAGINRDCRCLGGTTCPVGQECCYGAGTTCVQTGTCPFQHGCCRDSNDCGGDACCANTNPPSTSTAYNCDASCGGSGTRIVCAVPMVMSGCATSPSKFCSGAPAFSNPPGFYSCS